MTNKKRPAGYYEHVARAKARTIKRHARLKAGKAARLANIARKEAIARARKKGPLAMKVALMKSTSKIKATKKNLIAKTKTYIKPKAPAIISQQISKTKRLPMIIAGVVIAGYMILRRRKG